jgi:hypothetical protein
MTGVRIWMYQSWSSVIYLCPLFTVAAQRAIDVKETSGDCRRKQNVMSGEAKVRFRPDHVKLSVS